MLNGKQLIFTGIERPGMVSIHTMLPVADYTNSNTSDVTLQLESIYYGGGFGKTWLELYEQRETRALDVEDMR